MDRLMAEIPLARFQETFSMPGQVHAIVFGGNTLAEFQPSLAGISQIAEQNNLNILNWKELQPGLFQAIVLDISSAALIYLAMVVVVTFILLNTLFMSVLERTFEFGIMMGLGMRDYQIGLMIWMETILLLCIGLVFGMALGSAFSEYFGDKGVHFEQAEAMFQQFGLPGGMFPELNLFTLLAGPGLVSICIIIAGAFPILRLRQLDPVSAIRKV
jgi:ABC-type lipoprotein release transport system permease subunit